MKLDRNRRDDGHGKYAVVRMRRLDGAPAEIKAALALLLTGGFVTMDAPGGEDEFFVVMLKDAYAQAGLTAYAQAALDDGEVEYAMEVLDLAARSGPSNPLCKKPD